MTALSDLTSRDAVLQAIAECDAIGRDEFLKKYGYKRSRVYLLQINGNVYDSKAIVGVAHGKQHGQPLKSRDFSGGVATVIPALSRLGFESYKAEHPAVDLVSSSVYFRKDLRERYGGQLQKGIWTPKEFPVIFIFSGKSGEIYGYQDGWTEDGIFRYTGEGRFGDMEFTSGNASIRDHREQGKDILLFEDLGKGKGVRYAGLFECASWENVTGTDKAGDSRELIVFSLVPTTSEGLSEHQAKTSSLGFDKALSIEELRDAAYQAADKQNQKVSWKTAKRVWRERSDKVKNYVLARADGVCEGCELPAPFKKKDGTLYLEPHHTTRIADDGPDHPMYVAAVCPNCHRRIHSGEDGEQFNKSIKDKLVGLEKSQPTAR